MLNESGIEALATRLDVTDRHLRRVFQAEFGVSPVEFAQTHRLLLAKRLLTDTGLPITEVALASGFGSLRRFNTLFRERYRLSPTDLRKAVDGGQPADVLKFTLGYRPPLDWDALLSFLGTRAIEGVEHVETGLYARTVRLVQAGKTHAGWVAVLPRSARPRSKLRFPPLSPKRCRPCLRE